jgi:hypothetical protein
MPYWCMYCTNKLWLLSNAWKQSVCFPSMFLVMSLINSRNWVLHGKPCLNWYRMLCSSRGLSWPWSYGSWINNYLCNQWLSPLNLWCRISIMTRCTRYNIMWISLSLTCGRSVVFSWYSGFHHNITQILLKVALNTLILRSSKGYQWPLITNLLADSKQL